MSWNLWWRFGPWQERQRPILEALRAEAPDIALLQEVWSHEDDGDQAHQLAEHADLHVARSTRPDGTPYRFGNAVLSRWPILESETMVLPGLDGTPSHRSAVLTTVETPGGPQVVATTHLEWRYGQSLTRQQQLGVLVPRLDEWQRDRAPDRPIILGGDFNAVPDADEIRRLTGLAPGYGPAFVFTDCWAATSDEHGFTWTRENPHSAEAQWPRRRLDYVFVSWPRSKPTGNPLTTRLAGREPFDGVVPSDHYAVVAELDDRPPYDHEGTP